MLDKKEESITALIDEIGAKTIYYDQEKESISVNKSLVYDLITKLMDNDTEKREGINLNTIVELLEDGNHFIVEVLFNYSHKKGNSLETTDLEDAIGHEVGPYGRTLVKGLIEHVNEQTREHLNLEIKTPFPDVANVTIDQLYGMLNAYYESYNESVQIEQDTKIL